MHLLSHRGWAGRPASGWLNGTQATSDCRTQYSLCMAVCRPLPAPMWRRLSANVHALTSLVDDASAPCLLSTSSVWLPAGALQAVKEPNYEGPFVAFITYVLSPMYCLFLVAFGEPPACMWCVGVFFGQQHPPLPLPSSVQQRRPPSEACCAL